MFKFSCQWFIVLAIKKASSFPEYYLYCKTSLSACTARN